MSTLCNRTLGTWPWIGTWTWMPWSRNSLYSKARGRVDWTGQPPSSLPPPPLPPRATAWAPSMLTITTTAALSGHLTSGARALSPNRNRSPSGPTAPWAWLSPAAAACFPRLDSSRTWRLSPLLLLWLHRLASLPHLPSKPRFHKWWPLIVTRLSCAVASKRQAAASMAVSASLLMARQSCVDCSATPSTRPSPAEPSTTLATAPMAHAATLSMRTELAERRYHRPNSRISSNRLPVVRIHATSCASVSASPGSWGLHAAHLLHHSLHPSMILTWASAVLPLFPHLPLISSPQCLATPCSGRQQHSSLATIRPVPAPETSTTFLLSWSQSHAVCVAMEITLTSAESLPAWRTGTSRTAACCFLVLEATEDSWSLLDSSVSPLRTPWRTATAAAAEVPVEPSLQHSMQPPRGSLCLNACPCLTKQIQREGTEKNLHLVNCVCFDT